LIVDGKAGSQNRNLHRIDAKNGQARWKLPVAPDASGEFVLIEDTIYIQDTLRDLASVSQDGQVLWRRQVGTMRGTPWGTETLLAVVTQDELLVLDRPTGRTLSRIALKNARTGPVLRNKTVYVGTASGVCAFNLASRDVQWKAETGAVEGPLVVDRERIAYVNAASELVVLGLDDGKEQGRVAGALKNVAPVPARDTILFASAGGLEVFRGAKDGARQWVKTGWLGEHTSPLILAGSRVYFGTSKGGFACAVSK
jgi:outer membrane protein assembly factor BamB